MKYSDNDLRIVQRTNGNGFSTYHVQSNQLAGGKLRWADVDDLGWTSKESADHHKLSMTLISEKVVG